MAIDEKQLFDAVQLEMSPAFRRRLEHDLVAAARRESKEEGVFMVKVVENEVGHRADDGGLSGTSDSASSRHRRMKVVLAAAAAVVLVAALTVVIRNRGSEPAAVDTSRDVEIAEAALLEPSDIGVSWSVTHLWGDLTSRSIADSAATVPECAPYVDYAFDTAARDAVTAGRQFGIRGSELAAWIITQWVYIFPSEAAASKAMDKIAEPGFLTCFDRVLPLMYPGKGVASRLDPLPVSPHGDRQIVIGQHLVFGASPSDRGIPADTMNVWVQIGRAIVFVDPTESHDSLTTGRIERTVSAASDALQGALDNSENQVAN